MYNKINPTTTSITRNKSYVGETMEQKVNRIVNNKEPIKEPGVVLQYTERKDGVRPEFDPRTDYWELGLDAMDKVNRDKLAKRIERHQQKDDKLKEAAKEGMKKEGIGGAEPIQGDKPQSAT